MRGNMKKRCARTLFGLAVLGTLAMTTVGCSPQGQQRWAAFNWDCVAAGGTVHVYSIDVQCVWWANHRILAIEPLSYFE